MSTKTLQPMSAEQVFASIIAKKDLFILDVRNESEYNDWKIEGEKVESINIPYFTVLDGIEPVLEKLPNDKPILVVCAKEGSSVFVAEQLVDAGLENISFLSGGMKSWSEYLYPVKVGDLTGGGALYQFVRVGKGCLSYIIVSQGEAAVVDTARMIEPYVQFAKSENLTIKYTIDTHLHADHISGGRRLAEQFGGTYWLPPKDGTETTFEFNPLEDGKDLVIGEVTVNIHPVYSPGHTIGSTSLVIDGKYLLSGDILFVQSIGRPDLAGKAEDWAGDLRNSLYSTYRQMPEDLMVLPAHFSHVDEMDEQGSVHAILGDLYQVNAGLQVEDEQTFRTMVSENLPPQPNAYQEIRQTNMGKMDPDFEKQQEMEIGPNRCAVHR